MKVEREQAIKALFGKNGQLVYESMDFDHLPLDEENNIAPTMYDVAEALGVDKSEISQE